MLLNSLLVFCEQVEPSAASRVLPQMSNNGDATSGDQGVRVVSYETFASERKSAAATDFHSNGPSGSKPGADVYGRALKRQREGQEELLAAATQGGSERFRCSIM